MEDEFDSHTRYFIISWNEIHYEFPFFLNSYNGIDETKYTHKVVNHGRNEYVKGGDFTNTIEGFWGTLKRMIEGIYHSITSKYLQRYVDEAVYRYNCRKMKGCDCFRDMFAASIGVVDYNMVQMLEMAA